MDEPCHPIGCDNGYHLPGCLYIEVDSDDAAKRLHSAAEMIALITALVMPGRPTPKLIQELTRIAREKIGEAL